MKRLALAAVSGFALGFAVFALLFCRQPHCLDGTALAVFSPGSDDALLPLLNGASHNLSVEMYEFSNADFKRALVDAAARGVRVRVILEPRVDSNYETASYLAKNGVQVKWATQAFSNTHSKYAVIDGATVIVGSANWSQHAMDSNREADVVIGDARIAADFQAVFEQDWTAGQSVVA